MYGAQETTSSAGAILAVTGLTYSSWALAVFGVVFVAGGLYALFRKNGEDRP